MLNLENVTLVAMGSTDIKGMIKALEFSEKKIKFGAVKLVTHNTAAVYFNKSWDSKIEACECPNIPSIDDWNKNIVFELGSYIDTEYALLVHPDGFVVHPEAWRSEWLNYDYIGSPWPIPSPTDTVSYRDKDGNLRRVGNSVSLRSKKLLDLPKKLNMEWKAFHGFTNEDGYVCVNMRHVFEEHGCKFAPFLEALKFGREVPLPENRGIEPFVFHKHAGFNSIYPNFENT